MPVDMVQRLSHILTMPYSIMLYNCHGDFNIGVLSRTASCFSAKRVTTVGHRKWDRRTLVGSQNYTHIERYDTIDDMQEFFRTRKMYPVFIEQCGTDIDEFDFKKLYDVSELEPCLVVGSECDGVPQSMMDLFPESPRLSIAQPGVIRSFNVSSAGSMALYKMYYAYKKKITDTYGLL